MLTMCLTLMCCTRVTGLNPRTTLVMPSRLLMVLRLLTMVRVNVRMVLMLAMSRVRAASWDVLMLVSLVAWVRLLESRLIVVMCVF